MNWKIARINGINLITDQLNIIKQDIIYIASMNHTNLLKTENSQGKD